MTDIQIQVLARRFGAESTDENAQALARAVLRSVGSLRPRKVVVSPGYGLGFSSEMWDQEPAQMLAEDPALIAAIEEKDTHAIAAALYDLSYRVLAAFPEERFPHISHDDKWEVVEVSSPYIVKQYDGAESVFTITQANWIW